MNTPKSDRPKGTIWLCSDFGADSLYMGQMKMALKKAGIVNMEIYTAEVEAGNMHQMAYTLFAGAEGIEESDCIVSAMDAYDNIAEGIVYDCQLDSGKRIICFDLKYLSYIHHLSKDSLCKINAYNIKDLAGDKDISFFISRDILPILLKEEFGAIEPGDDSYETDDLFDEMFFKMPESKGNKIDGQMIFQDRFGNIITDIFLDNLEPKEVVLRDRYRVAFLREVSPQEKLTPFAYHGSDGFLEISLTGGNAAKEFGIRNGQSVVAVK